MKKLYLAQLDYGSMTINTDQRVGELKWRGIGSKTSLALAKNGFLTFATMRNLKESSNMTEASRYENLP